MRTQPMSTRTSGTATEYSVAQVLRVTAVFAVVVLAGLLALSYPAVAAAFLAGGLTAWGLTVAVARVRSGRVAETVRERTVH